MTLVVGPLLGAVGVGRRRGGGWRLRHGMGMGSASTNQVFGVLGGRSSCSSGIYLLGLGMLMGGELNAVLIRRRPD